MLTVQQALITLKLDLVFDAGTGSEGLMPMAILEYLSSESKGGSDRPLPALTSLSVLVLPQLLVDVKRLVQSRSAGQRIAALREVDIQVREWADSDYDSDEKTDQKDEHAALFKDFVKDGIDIRISHKWL